MRKYFPKKNDRGGMKRWDGMTKNAGLKKSFGMIRNSNMRAFKGMTSWNGMKVFQSSMKLFQAYEAPNPEQEFHGAVAAVGSSLLAIGGIALIILSSGTLTPVVGVAQSSMMAGLTPAIGLAAAGSGVSSSASAIISTINGNFELMDWTKNFFIQAGTSILTLGSGAGIGGITGIALTSRTALSSTAVKAISAASGGLAGL